MLHLRTLRVTAVSSLSFLEILLLVSDCFYSPWVCMSNNQGGVLVVPFLSRSSILKCGEPMYEIETNIGEGSSDCLLLSWFPWLLVYSYRQGWWRKHFDIENYLLECDLLFSAIRPLEKAREMLLIFSDFGRTFGQSVNHNIVCKYFRVPCCWGMTVSALLAVSPTLYATLSQLCFHRHLHVCWMHHRQSIVLGRLHFQLRWVLA